MKKFRKNLLELKEGWLSAKVESYVDVIRLANYIIISIIFIILMELAFLMLISKMFIISFIVAAIAIFELFFFLTNKKMHGLITRFSTKVLWHFFGRYGRVVTKEDWKNIKRFCPETYKYIWSKKSDGHCYITSASIALFLDDAKIMYCSIKGKNGDTGHSVIVKNNCVYDTNQRLHYDLEEYKKIFEVNVYKIFSKEEYNDEEFFDNIRDGFVKWCAERNVYCNPQ